MTVLEQMRSFTEAAIVISTHGPSLTHLVFARPRTLVVEVSNPAGWLPRVAGAEERVAAEGTR